MLAYLADTMLRQIHVTFAAFGARHYLLRRLPLPHRPYAVRSRRGRTLVRRRREESRAARRTRYH
jgi:hypothetical protein